LRIIIRADARLAPGASPQVGARRREEFQILAEGSWDYRIYPPEDSEGLLLPGASPKVAEAEPGEGHGRNWAVEGAPGAHIEVILYPVTLDVACNELPSDVEDCAWWRKSQWQGVNLGGWLVLEKWMAPELFKSAAPDSGAEDEYSLMELGGEDAKREVTRFRDIFVKREDFAWLRNVGGINAVRLPLGFWCLKEHAAGTPYLPTENYADCVFDWAEEFGLRVLVDFHGASGSQNSDHHCGNSASGVHWLDSEHRTKNLEVLVAWARRWGRRKAFLGLGFGNEVQEPADAPEDSDYWGAVMAFYEEAAALVRPHLREDAPLVVDTCWDSNRFLGDRLDELPGPVWLDYHHYQCHGKSDKPEKSAWKHSEAKALRDHLSAGPPPPQLLLGEFSLALKPRAEGYEEEGWQQRFFERQALIASQQAMGWFFWNYRMARGGWAHWSYRECVERGWIVPPFATSEVVQPPTLGGEAATAEALGAAKEATVAEDVAVAADTKEARLTVVFGTFQGPTAVFFKERPLGITLEKSVRRGLLSRLCCSHRRGRVIVQQVDPRSPAANLGIGTGCELIAFGGQNDVASRREVVPALDFRELCTALDQAVVGLPQARSVPATTAGKLGTHAI